MLQGLDWRSSKAVDKLKKMLWGLEALRVFDDRLSASLSQIQKAREAMERTIKQASYQITVMMILWLIHDSGGRRASRRFTTRICKHFGRIRETIWDVIRSSNKNTVENQTSHRLAGWCMYPFILSYEFRIANLRGRYQQSRTSKIIGQLSNKETTSGFSHGSQSHISLLALSLVYFR